MAGTLRLPSRSPARSGFAPLASSEIALLFVLCATGCARSLPGDGTDAAAPDLSAPRDLRPVEPQPDLTAPPDLTGPADLIPPVDLTVLDLTIVCPPGFGLCGGQCIDLMSAPADCGACGKACAGGQACVAGQCRCTPASCLQGCCQGNSCLPGNADNACGAGGQACATCMTRCANGGCLGCTPGAVDTQPCGNCGTHRRTCDNQGVWGSFTMCAGEGPCAPAARRMVACGNCGMQTDTCSNACQWVAGACNGQGACKPGSTTGVGCDVCSQKSCDNACNFGPCALKPGSACEYNGGNHNRACNCRQACNGNGLQWCLNTCQWSLDCACCNGQGCNNTCL